MTQTYRRPSAPLRRDGQPQRRPAPRPQARPQAPRGAAPVRRAPARGRGSGGEILRIAVGGLVAVALAFLLQRAWPDGFPLRQRGRGAQAVEMVAEIHSAGPLRINEIMSGNRRTLATGNGDSPDWIEVANVGKSEVSLKGCALSKGPNDANVFTFPDVRLAPGECALVLADGHLRAEAAEDLHAPFRLSSAGDTLMLFNAGGSAVDTVNLPALGADQSYARTDESHWQICATPTPGQPNTDAGYRALTEPEGDSPVVLTELMSTNRSTLADENGEYYDYIELYNRSDAAVNLAGWHLSDDSARARMWRFPEVEIGPGEYLVVFASKLDRRDDPAHLHTNFALSSEGEQAVLSDARGRVMDRVEFGLLKADTAWSKGADGSWSAAAPSPGRANP